MTQFVPECYRQQRRVSGNDIVNWRRDVDTYFPQISRPRSLDHALNDI